MRQNLIIYKVLSLYIIVYIMDYDTILQENIYVKKENQELKDSYTRFSIRNIKHRRSGG